MSAEPDDRVLMAYLLGQVSEETRIEIERGYLSDSAVFDRLLAMEGELLDRYSSGELSPEQQAIVAGRLKVSPDLSERLMFAHSLQRLATQHPRDASVSPARVRWPRVLAPRHLAWAASLLLVAVSTVYYLGGLVPRGQNGESTSSKVVTPSDADTSRRPIVAEPTAGPTPLPLPARSSVDLYPGALRDGRERPDVPISVGQTHVDVTAHLDEDLPAGTRGLVMTLRRLDGDEVWRHTIGVPQRAAAGLSIRLSIPTATLHSGEYVLTALSLSASEPSPVIAYYALRIRRLSR